MRWKLLIIFLILILLAIAPINSDDTFIEPQILKNIENQDIPVIVEVENPLETDIELQQLSETEYSTKINEQELQELLDDPNVISITEDPVAKILLSGSVPLINASVVQAKQYSTTNLTGKSQSICIIDTGIDATQPGLAGRIIAQKCFCDYFDNGAGGCCPDTTSESNTATDDHGHGTHVAGIAAGNGSTITGVAPEANIVAVKVTNSEGYTLFSDITQAITWCSDNATLYNISVISISLGGGSYSTACDSSYTSLSSAIDSAWNNNVSVVVASGNDNSLTNMASPACITKVISVSSTTKADIISSFSNRNQLTDILAPGTSITSTKLSGGTESRSGTSMATPHVAGAIAILQQYKINVEGRHLSSQELNDSITTHGPTIDDSANSGKIFYRLDVLKSLWDLDDLAPSIINPNTSSQTNYIYNNVTFTATITDINLNSIWIEGNWSGTPQNYSITNNYNGQYNYSINNASFTKGQIFQWRIYSNDSNNNVNLTSWFNTTILTGAPNITLHSPINNTNTNNNSNTLNFTATDDFDLTMNCILYLNSVKNETKNITSSSVSLFNPVLTDNTYTWHITCNDSENSMSNSSSNILIIDTTKPIFSAESFTQIVELGDNQSYSINITDTYLTYANFSFQESNYSMTNNSNTFSRSFQTTQNSTNNFVVYASDVAGNINFTSNSFIVNDSISGPRITNLIYKSSLAQNSVQYVNAWILNSQQISSVYISVSGVNYSMTNTTQYNYSYSFTAASCGATSFKIFSNDSNNFGITNTTNYTITTCCGDGTCNNGETCTSCLADCGACTPAASTTGGGGGGGGGTKTTTNLSTSSLAPEIVQIMQTVTQTIAEASPAKPIEMVITNAEVPITNIFINVNDNLNNVEINIKTLSGKPTELSQPKGIIYQYLEFITSNITDAQINNAIISFKVPSQWFIDNQVDKNTITLNRYNAIWEKLPTTLANEQNDTIYYTANSTGFSYFAIAGEKITAPVTEETQPTETEKTNTIKIILYSVLTIVILIAIILFFVHDIRSKV